MATLTNVGLLRHGGTTFSTKEYATSLCDPFNGKRIFRKAISIGALANATDKTVAHSIATLNVAKGAHFRISGTVSDGTDTEDLSVATGVSRVRVNATNVVVTSTTDLTGSNAVVYLEYTKS